MASEATQNVNGIYDGQYNQPAELAASTPSHNTATQSQASTSAQQKADPQEIGWYFVEQYYTTLSKTPERIHLFYSKKSQLVTGNEAEKVVPAVGSKVCAFKLLSSLVANSDVGHQRKDQSPRYPGLQSSCS